MFEVSSKTLSYEERQEQLAFSLGIRNFSHLDKDNVKFAFSRTSLGLSINYEIIGKFIGIFTVGPILKEGTEFILTLPIKQYSLDHE